MLLLLLLLLLVLPVPVPVPVLVLLLLLLLTEGVDASVRAGGGDDDDDDGGDRGEMSDRRFSTGELELWRCLCIGGEDQAGVQFSTDITVDCVVLLATCD